MNIKVRWWLYIIPSLLITLVCWITVPFVCMFVKRTNIKTTVKRLGKIEALLPRDNLIWLFQLWNTHDNNSDEGWYGAYKINSIIPGVTKYFEKVTKEMYDAKTKQGAIIRWYYRVWWLQRNCGYGWTYLLLSLPYEEPISVVTEGDTTTNNWKQITTRPSSFQIKSNKPFLFGKINDSNIGWKAHKGKPKLLYALRPIGLRNPK